MSLRSATGIQNIKSPTGDFQYLLKMLGYIILHGRTTNLIPYDKYIDDAQEYPLNGLYKSFNG